MNEPLTLERVRSCTNQLRIPNGGPRWTNLHRALTEFSDENACWPWPGPVSTNGYGVSHYPKIGSAPRKGTTAHRRIWELLFGEVPEGMQIDHACHNPAVCRAGSGCPHRRCVNPWHLRLATPAENQANSNSPSYLNKMKTHCVRGHEFSPENTAKPDAKRPNKRACLTCRRLRKQHG